MNDPSLTATAGAQAGIDAIHRDGIATLKGALPRRWAADLLADFEVLYAEAEARDLGSPVGQARARVPRGPGEVARRYYLAVHPERVRGFRDLVSNRLVDAVCRGVLGDDYQFVELGFDVAMPGAVRQPLHRDFPTPPETEGTGRLSSLAINATCLDVTPEMGPLEIAPGTHFDDSADFDQGMRVPAALSGRYEQRLERRMPKAGDVSLRSGLAIHRGTENVSPHPRPVLILGVMAAQYETFADHDLTLTRDYYESLPTEIKAHLRRCALTEELRPIAQEYVLDFLLEEG